MPPRGLVASSHLASVVPAAAVVIWLAYLAGQHGLGLGSVVLLCWLLANGLHGHVTREVHRHEIQAEARLRVRLQLAQQDGYETAEWCNVLLGGVWEEMRPYFSESLRCALEGILMNYRPKFLDDIRVNHLTLGEEGISLNHTKATRLANVQSDGTSHTVVQIDAHLTFPASTAHAVIAGKLKKVPVTVSFDVGQLHVRFQVYLCDRPPYISCLKVTFLHVPDVDFVLKPLASFDASEMPVFSTWLDETLHGLIKSTLVRPNELTFQFERSDLQATESSLDRGSESSLGLQRREVLGVLVLQAIEADLPKNIGPLGPKGFTLSLAMGDGSVKTGKMRKPEKGATVVFEETFYFLVYSRDEHASILLKENVSFKRERLLGKVSLPFSEYSQAASDIIERMILLDSGHVVKMGMLFRYVDESAELGGLAVANQETMRAGILTIEIHDAIIGSTSKTGVGDPYCKLSINGHKEYKSKVVRRSAHPFFNDIVHVVVENVYTAQLQAVVKDANPQQQQRVIGLGELKLVKAFQESTTARVWVDLADGSTKDPARHKLCLTLRYRPIPDLSFLDRATTVLAKRNKSQVTDKRTLIVTVLEGHDLALGQEQQQSEVSVVVKWEGELIGKTTPRFGANPEWGETMKAPVDTKDMEGGREGKLTFTVVCGKGSSEKKVGKAEIKITLGQDIPLQRRIVVQPYATIMKAENAHKVIGELTVQAKISDHTDNLAAPTQSSSQPQFPVDFISSDEEEEEGDSRPSQEVVSSTEILKAVPTSPRVERRATRMSLSNPLKKQIKDPDLVELEIVAATDIEGKAPNPYVEVRSGSNIIYKSEVKPRTSNPVWKETTKVVVSQWDSLHFRLRDKGSTIKDSLGRTEVKLSTIPYDARTELQLPLQGVSHGVLHLRLNKTNTRPESTSHRYGGVEEQSEDPTNRKPSAHASLSFPPTATSANPPPSPAFSEHRLSRRAQFKGYLQKALDRVNNTEFGDPSYAGPTHGSALASGQSMPSISNHKRHFGQQLSPLASAPAPLGGGEAESLWPEGNSEASGDLKVRKRRRKTQRENTGDSLASHLKTQHVASDSELSGNESDLAVGRAQSEPPHQNNGSRRNSLSTLPEEHSRSATAENSSQSTTAIGAASMSPSTFSRRLLRSMSISPKTPHLSRAASLELNTQTPSAATGQSKSPMDIRRLRRNSTESIGMPGSVSPNVSPNTRWHSSGSAHSQSFRETAARPPLASPQTMPTIVLHTAPLDGDSTSAHNFAFKFPTMQPPLTSTQSNVSTSPTPANENPPPQPSDQSGPIKSEPRKGRGERSDSQVSLQPINESTAVEKAGNMDGEGVENGTNDDNFSGGLARVVSLPAEEAPKHQPAAEKIPSWSGPLTGNSPVQGGRRTSAVSMGKTTLTTNFRAVGNNLKRFFDELGEDSKGARKPNAKPGGQP